MCPSFRFLFTIWITNGRIEQIAIWYIMELRFYAQIQFENRIIHSTNSIYKLQCCYCCCWFLRYLIHSVTKSYWARSLKFKYTMQRVSVCVYLCCELDWIDKIRQQANLGTIPYILCLLFDIFQATYVERKKFVKVTLMKSDDRQGLISSFHFPLTYFHLV